MALMRRLCSLFEFWAASFCGFSSRAFRLAVMVANSISSRVWHLLHIGLIAQFEIKLRIFSKFV